MFMRKPASAMSERTIREPIVTAGLFVATLLQALPLAATTLLTGGGMQSHALAAQAVLAG